MKESLWFCSLALALATLLRSVTSVKIVRGKSRWSHTIPKDPISGNPIDCSHEWYCTYPGEICNANVFPNEYMEEELAQSKSNRAIQTCTSVDSTNAVPLKISRDWWRQLLAPSLNLPQHSNVNPIKWYNITTKKQIVVGVSSEMCDGGFMRIVKKGRFRENDVGVDYIFSYLKGYSRLARVNVDKIDTMSWCFATENLKDGHRCSDDVLAEFPEREVTHLIVHVCDFRSLEYLCDSTLTHADQLSRVGVVKIIISTFTAPPIPWNNTQCLDRITGLRSVTMSQDIL
eukprot:CFRG4385T1